MHAGRAVGREGGRRTCSANVFAHTVCVAPTHTRAERGNTSWVGSLSLRFPKAGRANRSASRSQPNPCVHCWSRCVEKDSEAGSGFRQSFLVCAHDVPCTRQGCYILLLPGDGWGGTFPWSSVKLVRPGPGHPSSPECEALGTRVGLGSTSSPVSVVCQGSHSTGQQLGARGGVCCSVRGAYRSGRA